MTRPHRLAQLMGDRRAVTALEYGIIASFFCVLLLTIFTKFGSVLTALYAGVDNGL